MGFKIFVSSTIVLSRNYPDELNKKLPPIWYIDVRATTDRNFLPSQLTRFGWKKIQFAV